MGLLACLEAEVFFSHADVALAADDYVVDDLDIHEFSGLDEAFCHGDVFGAWLGVSGRVVVDDDDGGACPSDGFCEDLCGADEGGVDAAHVEVMDGLDLVFGV